MISENEIALRAFEKIRATFPMLTMKVDLHPEHVDLAMDIPAQPGLSFDVALNLQNRDELHLNASALWVEWFPCSKPKRVNEYVEAVTGILSGEFRIVEYWRGKRAVKAKLERPSEGGWKRVASTSHLLSIPWPRKTIKIVQNLASLRSNPNKIQT